MKHEQTTNETRRKHEGNTSQARMNHEYNKHEPGIKLEWNRKYKTGMEQKWTKNKTGVNHE